MKQLSNALVIGLVVLLLVFLGFASYHSTDSTEVGVRTVKWLGKRGVQPTVYQPGAAYFFLPIINDWDTFDTRLQVVEMKEQEQMALKMKDGNDLYVDVTFSYRIDPQRAPFIRQYVARNDEELEQKVFITVARSRTRDFLGALSTDNDTPDRASRPFDATRNGFLLGEGAGFLVLEEWEAARRRGARIYAELAGDGNSLSSYRITDSPPDGDGPIQAMRQALADAGATVADVDYLNAHGTSTPMNDLSESAATRAVFGAEAARVSVSSTKSTTGHLIAAAGAVEVAACALAIAKGEMPINANLTERDPECDLNLVIGAPRRQRIRVAMSNSFGFGGSNSCVALRNPEEVDGAGAVRA